MPAPPTRIELTDGWIDLIRFEVERIGAVTALTRTEATLLRYLASRAGEVVTREELLQAVWGYRQGVRSRTVETTVSRVRAKIEADRREPRHLHTVFGVGYRFDLLDDTAGPGIASGAFVGRAEELHRVLEALEEGGLVTLVGPGGMGKTRLAAELVRCRSEPSAWASLVGADDLTSAIHAVGHALRAGLQAASPEQALKRLGRAASAIREDTVLVLDNAEDTGEALEPLLETLRGAPALRVLCTSRMPLRCQGERVVSLGPLDAEAAVALLLERAGPSWSGADPRVVQRIAERLDGHPLALELAVAYAPVLGPDQVYRRLEASATGLRRPGADRHAVLRAVLEGTWELLDTPAATLLGRVSVLHHPFDAEVVEAIGGEEALPALMELRERGLVVPAEGHRLRVLDLVREFAAEHVEDPGRVARDLAAHLADRPDLGTFLEDGVRLVRWLVEDDPELAARLACGLARFTYLHFEPMRTRQILDLVEGVAMPEALRLELRVRRGLWLLRADPGRCAEVAAELERLIQAVDATGRTDLRGLARFALAVALRNTDPTRGLAVARDASTALGGRLDPTLAGGLLREVGLNALRAGRLEEAEAAMVAALRHAREDEEARDVAAVLQHLAVVLLHRDRFEAAEARLIEALELFEALDEHHGGVPGCQRDLGAAHHARGRYAEAAHRFEEAAEGYERLGLSSHAALCRANLAAALLELGETGRAEALLREVLHVFRAEGTWRFAAASAYNLALLALARGEVGVAEEALAEARGAASRTGAAALVARVAAGEALTGLFTRPVGEAVGTLAEATDALEAAGMPDAAELRFVLAAALARMGRSEASREQLRRATEGFRGTPAQRGALLAAAGPSPDRPESPCLMADILRRWRTAG